MKFYKSMRGFTLIELLVVISIIAVLMSILMPAMSKVKSQAMAITCGTRLKDISTAINLYVADNKGDIPASFPMTQQEVGSGMATVWIDRICGYYDMKNTGDGGFKTSAHNTKYFRCPTQEYILEMEKEAVESNSPYMTSPKTGIKYKMTPGAGTYGMNAFFSGRGAISGYQELNYRK